MEFETPNFQAWKVPEIDQRPGNFAFTRSTYKNNIQNHFTRHLSVV